MENESWANLIGWMHIMWIGFVLLGFFWTLTAFLFHRRFFEYFWFRTVHITGVILVTLLPLLGLYCPLTGLEFSLRFDLDSSAADGFIFYYLHKLLGSDLIPYLPLFIQAATWTIFLSTAAAYFFRPPERVRQRFKRSFGRLQKAAWPQRG